MSEDSNITGPDKELVRRFYDSGFWQDQTVYQTVLNKAEQFADKIAIEDKYRSLSYAELLQSVDSFAKVLEESGLNRGEKIALWLPNRLETVIVFLACSKNRYVCCPSLHRNHTLAEVLAVLQRFSISTLIYEKNYAADVEGNQLEPELEKLSRKAYALDPLMEKAGLEYPFAISATEESKETKGPGKDDPDSLVYLPFTSGTTGEPKGVMHSDNTLMANSRAIANDWHFSSDSVIYTLSPLSHNLGFGAMVTALSVGGKIVLSSLSREESLIEHLLETGATFIYGVPAHALDLLNETKERDSNLLSSIVGFRISGAAAQKHVVAGLLAYGIVPQTGYGMTEAHSHNYTLADDEPNLIIESAGKACPGYELKIWSLQDRDVEAKAGEEGQIGGKGASLMLGYYDDEQANKNAFNASAWYMTGDIGRLDDNGYLYLSGRIKDIINRGGHKIYPTPIEKMAEAHEEVQKAAVIAMHDERLGERVCIVVVLEKGSSLQAMQLMKHFSDAGLSRYDMPEYFARIEELPLTPSGKLMKRTLVEMLGNGSLIAKPVN
jgi:acyl-CoA synthetase (AMP-forming)/AMP-acid ligase II